MSLIAVDFSARGLHTRTAVARLPLRQLRFLVFKSHILCYLFIILALTYSVVCCFRCIRKRTPRDSVRRR